jgi:hypothetical protein
MLYSALLDFNRAIMEIEMSQMTQYYQNKYYQKYDEVEALKKRIAELEAAQQQWISVKDRLPDSKERVIWYTEEIEDVAKYRLATGDMRHAMNLATHWTPLPTPPTEQDV